MKNLRLVLMFSIFILNLKSYAQSNIGIEQRDYSYNAKKEKLKSVSLSLTQNGRVIEVNLLGELVSYKASMGDEIEIDYNKKIKKIGSLELEYDFYNRVTRFGESLVSYSFDGKMSEIGKYEVLYSYDGEFKGTKEKVQKYYRSW
jgi:hypothetical protein